MVVGVGATSVKLKASQPSALLRVAERLDRHAVRFDDQGRAFIDPAEARDANWALAKTQFMMATGGAVFTGAAALDHFFSPFGKVVGGILAVVAGGTTATLVAMGLKNSVDAAVWGVVGGARKIFGQGAPLH